MAADTLRVGHTTTLRLSTDVEGVSTDPTTLQVTITKPDASSSVFVYGVDAALVRDETGEFHINVLCDQAGRWRYRWVGTGAVVLDESGTFEVRPLKVLSTVHVQSAGPVALANVYVTLEQDGFLVASGKSDASGNLTFYLEPGTYAVRCDRLSMESLYSTITVAGAATHTLTCVPLGTVAPTLTLRRLFGYLLDPTTGQGADVDVHFSVLGQRGAAMVAAGGTGVASESSMLSPVERKLRPAQNGVWEIDVAVGAWVRVFIPTTGFDRTFQVPAGSAPLNVVDARPPPEPSHVGVISDVSSYSPASRLP